VTANEDLALRDLHLCWPNGAVLFEALNLQFAQGKITAIVGETGCGKSTLLRLMAHLLAPSQGDVSHHGGSRSFVFQSPNLLPWRTVAENVGLPLVLEGRSGATEVIAALESVGLDEHAGKLPHMLSGGMQMRTALARALITRPSVLFMDEPFSALDALTRHKLQQEFLALWREHRFTVLLVTHDIDAAIRLADRVVVLGGAPASVQMDLPIDLPRPRELDLRHDPRTGSYIRRVEGAL